MSYKHSQEAFNEAVKVLPGGVNSPVRAFHSVKSDPVFIKNAYQATLVDEDDNSYLDYIGSWGPMILGHSHPLLNECLIQHINDGISFGLPTSIEVTLAKQIVDAYAGIDMVRMVNSGTEATMSAIRVARGYTKKDKIIKFEGCYHGHSDGLLVKSGSGTLTFGMPTSPGVPADIVKNTLVCTYNDINSVQASVQANENEIAAIIIEPIAANMGVVEADKIFLKQLRELCDKQNIVLIFDEVISGFRLGYGGAANYYGITPDMACFGKIIGGGLPVGAYGGKQEIMQMVSPSGPVYQAGTLSGNPLAMHLGSTLLSYLQEHPEVYEQINQKALILKQGMESVLKQYNLLYQIQCCGSLLTLFFCEHPVKTFSDVQKCDTDLYAQYFQGMLKRHIMLAPSQYEAMFISAAHTEKDIQYTIDCFAEVMKEMQNNA